MSDGINELDDEVLVELAKSGSPGAFEAVYNRHARGVARSLASFAGTDRDLLDDLVQEVFLRVVRGLPAYEAQHGFARWLFTIALNVGRNHARRRPIASVDPTLLDDVAENVDCVERAMAAIDVMALVTLLPMEMRDVVALRVGSELSYSQIADILAIPEGTARSRMHNAIGILREHCRARRLDKEQHS